MAASNDTPSAQGVDYDPFAGGALERVVPSTEPQREVWLADRLGPDASLAYNESVSLRLTGALDVSALQRALQGLVDRHDALRATFGPDGETFCVLAECVLEVDRHDLSALSDEARTAARDARLRAVVEAPFSLEHDRLFRAELLRLAPDDHQLLLTAHHIVCDGWSWWVLVRELAALYSTETGAPVAALEPAEQFADYALAEALHPGGAAFAADERYWLSRFADGTPTLDLPTDRPRPARRSFASAREDVVVDAATVAALRRMGARRGASLFATLLGGFAATMSRLASQDDVVVGIPAAGQSLDGHDSLVGHAVNTLPLRFVLDGAQPATQLVDDAQATLLDALEHQRYTFGTLLRSLRIARDPARLPLISVLFNIDQALDQESAAFPGLQLDFAANPRTYENFELFVNAVQAHGELRLECQYNRDLFDAGTVRRWLHGYATLLRELADRPETAIGDLRLVDADARARLDALQPFATDVERSACLHTLFERQCDRTPGRIAVRSGDDALTYAQLDARANRIAHLLRANDVHAGTLVGLAVDRGTDMLAAMLGVLKAGAGYVPLDPGYPSERLAYMAGDAGLAALLTQSHHAHHFDLRGRPVLALDTLDDVLAGCADARIDAATSSPDPESVAYVIYTSGSTGRPKGVQVPHRAVVNFLGSMAREPGLAADDVLVAVTTLSFDIAVLELFLPLTVGAQTVIADRETAMDGAALARLLSASGATVMQATPATWRMLVDSRWTGASGFRALCGGEPLPPDLARALLTRCAALWNLYGPTETTVWSTCARILPGADGGAPDVHIGRPIANTRVWIVDARGGLCPEGVPGEICIAGEGVTLGYLYRPELTAERFVPDAFAHHAGGAHPVVNPPMYRTGDRGRWRADGNLEHQGRLDFQVKVRGFRIELGEIENVLLAHADVAQALAMAREDRPGDVRLVAYVIARPGVTVDDRALLAHCAQSLPDYMVPQHLLALKSMPLLPNGKIDRSALPPPVSNLRSSEGDLPRNAREETIVSAMAAVLGMPVVGIHDDFFALGGHSLLAAKLTTRLSHAFGIRLSLRALFDAPTAARLASLVADDVDEHAARRTSAGDTASDSVPRRVDQRTAPLTPLQDRVRMVEAFNPGTTAFNTPSSHRLTGPLDSALLDRAFRDIAQRQTVLRTSIGSVDGEPMQIVHDDIDPGLAHVIDLTGWPAEQREAEALRQMQASIDAPFDDLASAPLFRASLFRIADDQHLLFFMPHHVVWDGWSFDLLYDELSETYAALVEARAPQLAALPVTYGDHAAWQRDWMRGPAYATQVDFWGERLLQGAHGEGVEALPTDRPRRRGLQVESRALDVAIAPETAERLRAIAGRLGVTLFTVLLTAYQAALARLAGQPEIVVGTLVRGRNTFEVEHLMGYFTNLLPLRQRIEPGDTFSTTVARTRDVLLDGFAHPDIRIEDLPAGAALRNEAGAAMFYHAQFSFQDVRQRTTHWGPLRHERVEVLQPGASEDVALLVVDSARGMAGSVVYNGALFDENTMRTLRDRFIAILQRVAIDPAQRLDVLSTLEDTRDAVAPKPDMQAAPPTPARDAAAQSPAPPTTGSEPMQTMAKTALDPRETYLLGLWSEALGTMVLPSDNFFDIGGNSLMAVQMAERVARETGYRIKLMRLAVQSASDIAADLPADAGSMAPPAAGGKLLQRMRRLLGSS